MTEVNASEHQRADAWEPASRTGDAMSHGLIVLFVDWNILSLVHVVGNRELSGVCHND
jgi:hypothetical protein